MIERVEVEDVGKEEALMVQLLDDLADGILERRIYEQAEGPACEPEYCFFNGVGNGYEHPSSKSNPNQAGMQMCDCGEYEHGYEVGREMAGEPVTTLGRCRHFLGRYRRFILGKCAALKEGFYDA